MQVVRRGFFSHIPGCSVSGVVAPSSCDSLCTSRKGAIIFLTCMTRNVNIFLLFNYVVSFFAFQVYVFIDGTVLRNGQIRCPTAAMQETPVTCCIGGWQMKGVSLRVCNEAEWMRANSSNLLLPIATNSRSLVLSTGTFSLFRGRRKL